MKGIVGRKRFRVALVISAICAIIVGVVLWRVVLPLVTVEVEVVDPSDSGNASSSTTVIQVGDYYRISYQTADLSQTEVHGGEGFSVMLKLSVTSTGNLLITPSQSQTTTRYVAIHQVSRSRAVLNPGHTVIVDPIPTRKGDSAEVSEVVPLQFPEGSESGDYDVVVEFVEAKVKILFWWMDVSGYVPSTETIGSVTYVPGAL